MRLLVLSTVLLLAVSLVNAQILTSFVEGPQEYEFRVTGQTEEATLRFPLNACASSFELTMTPSDIVEAGARPIDAVLITDISGSMGWNMAGQSGTSHPSRLSIAKQASAILIDNFVGSGLDNRLALVSYATNSRLDRAFTDNSAALKSTVDSYEADGATCISCGVRSALLELVNAREDAVKVIFLMTDGEANRVISSCDGDDYSCRGIRPTRQTIPTSEDEARDLVCSGSESAVGRGYITHAIAISTGAGLDFMRSIADCEGNDGEYYEGFTEEEVLAIYEELARFETSSWPHPQMTIAGERVLRTSADARNPIAIDGQCSGCEDPLLALQEALYYCHINQMSCDVPVSTWSTSRGDVSLHNLRIEYETSGIRATDDGFVCTTLPYCGDDTLDSGEQCEPPGTDTCDENCQLIGDPLPGAVCGNWIHEEGEECDWGDDNEHPDYDCGAAPGQWCWFCSTDCEWIGQYNPGDTDPYVCGNGIPEPGEECDRGPLNGVSCTPKEDQGCEWCTDHDHELGGCNLITVPPIGTPPPNCGDGTIDWAEGEECDDGVGLNGVKCDPEYGEECTYCSLVCTEITVDGGSCGDGLWQQEYEECDPVFHPGKCNDDCEWEGTDDPEVIDPGTGQPPLSGFVEIEISTRRYFNEIKLNDYIKFDEVFEPNPSVTWEVTDYGGLDGAAAPSIVLVNGYFALDDVFDDTGTYYPEFFVTDPAGNWVYLKFRLTVIDSIGQPPGEPDTRLMITKGTMVSGHFEADPTGQVPTWGPYTLNVRVWQR